MANSTQTSPESTNWNISKNRKNLKGMYTLGIVDLEQVSGASTGVLMGDRVVPLVLSGSPTASIDIKTTTGNFDANLKSNLFLFPVNPKAISMEEPPSMTIVALQNGGKYIEHQGGIFKMISISGTTGLRPNINKPSNPVFSVPFANIKDIFKDGDSIPVGEVTGFDDFVHLRNMFRAYYDAKQDPAIAYKTVMVWGSAKEEDYWIVEPTAFKVSRDSSNKFTYNYEISLKTIQQANLISHFPEDKTDGSSFFSAMKSIQNFSNNIRKASDYISNNIDQAGLLVGSIMTDFLGPVNTLLNGLANVNNSLVNLVNLPKNIIANAMSGATNFLKSIGKLTNSITGFPKQFSMGSGLDGLLLAAKSIIYEVATIAALRKDAKLAIAERISSSSAAYSNTVHGFRQQSTSVNVGAGAPSAPRTNASGARAAVLPANVDIYRLALQETGNAGNAQSIIALNNLEAPYFSPVGNGRTVLRPGQTVLIPHTGSSALIQEEQTSDSFTENVYELALGKDFRLRDTSSGLGEARYDIDISSNGDLNMITGVPNMEQAMTILFGTDQGELRVHPSYGIKFPIGSKGELRSLVAFKLHTKAVILRDNRVSDITSISYKLDGNQLRINAGIRLKDSSEIMNTTVGVTI